MQNLERELSFKETTETIPSTGMTRKPQKNINPHKSVGMSRMCVLEDIFYAEDFNYSPDNAILQIDWNKMEEQHMGRNDLCLCGSGKKQKKCHADLYEGSVLAELWKKLLTLDNEIQRQKEKNCVEFLCPSSCHECCDEYFYVSEVEYFLIRNHLQAIAPDVFELAKEEGKQQYKLLQEECPEEYKKLNTNVTPFNMFKDCDIIEKFKTCPFVDKKTGKCLVYKARPIICRLYGTSYRYNACEFICEHISECHDKTKTMVNVPYDDYLKENVDVFYGAEQSVKISRPFPLLYWLAMDEKYSKEYIAACSMDLKSYSKFVARENL